VSYSFRIALAALIAVPGFASAAPPTVGGCQVFPANNYWNTPVDTLPLHPSSFAWTSTIGLATKLHPDWGNVVANYYGIPYTTVTSEQPLVPVSGIYEDESDPGPYPIPPDAPIEGGPDPRPDAPTDPLPLRGVQPDGDEQTGEEPSDRPWDEHAP